MKQMTEFFHLMEEARREAPLLVCYLDGFGYYMYKEATCPFIEENFLISPIETVRPPVTNPSMATMITGVLPEVHGVYSRKERLLKVSTIFAKDMGKTAFIEGDSMILKTEIFPSLHPGDEEHTSDYYVYEETLEAIKEENEFIFVHFHCIDDLAHTYGPYHKKVKNHIQVVDQYIEEIYHRFCGKLLLISDHGLHEVEEGGTHGVLVDGDYVKEDITALLGVDKRYDGRIKGL